MTPFEMVREFHQIFGLPVRKRPVYDVKNDMMRGALLTEETAEFIAAMASRDLVEMADALADIVYVAYGAALTFGIDLDAVIAEVHKSNMTKLGGDGKPVYRPDGKVIKGPHYKAPDIEGILGLRER